MEKRKNVRGSITVCLCLCLSVTVACIGVLLESARIRGIVGRADRIAHSALESVMADYNRTMMERYHLFLLDYGKGGENGKEAALRMKTYLEKEADDSAGNLIYDLFFDCEWFEVGEMECSIVRSMTLLDAKGEIFANQAAQYMKYQEIGNLVSLVTDQIKVVLGGKSGQDALWQTGKKDHMENIAFWGDNWSVHLSMVLPEGRNLSQTAISAAGLPSRSQGIFSQAPGNRPMWNEMTKEVLVGEYLLGHFPDFTDEAEGERISCQLEYILFGKLSDQNNMARMADWMVAVRCGLNLISLLSSESMQAAANAAAASISALLLNPELAPLIQIVIECIWAYQESIHDVSALLQGESLPLLKEESQWLESVVPFGEGTDLPENAGEIGEAAQENPEAEAAIENLRETGRQAGKIRSMELSYEDYIRIFLLLLPPAAKYYRAMDMIQIQMQKEHPEFQMANAICGMEAAVSGKGKPKFFLFLPRFVSPWEKTDAYEITRTVSILY